MFRKDCEPEIEKQCKEKKPPQEKVEPECKPQLPPTYEEKDYFKLDSKDPIVHERAKCLENCHVKPTLVLLRECEKRVTSKLLYTAENCHEETVYLMEALDQCVKAKGFNRLV